MIRLRWYLFGALSLVIIEALAAVIALQRTQGLSARAQPGSIERWVARRAWHAALPAGAADRTNPIPKTPEVLAEARAHWADHCAIWDVVLVKGFKKIEAD